MAVLFQLTILAFSFIMNSGGKNITGLWSIYYRNTVFFNAMGISFLLLRKLSKGVTCAESIRKNLIDTALTALSALISFVLGTYIGFKFLLYMSWVEYFPYERMPVYENNGLFVIIVFTLYTVYANYRLELRHILDRQHQIETESRLKLLQSKLNPHFLFNTLNSLISLGYDNEPEKLEQTIQSLSDIYRNILYLPDDFQVPLRKELDLVTSYLEIERLRFQERLEYEINADEELMDMPIMPLIIEVCVENAVIHGITPKDSGGKVTVNIMRAENMLQIDIIDNGIGFEADRANKTSSGYGLSSLRERIAMFYGNKGIFRIFVVPEGGTRVHLEVPCK